MSKYIDKEKLIDMIDNSIAYCQINYSDEYALGFEQSLREVKNFIDSLQQEQQEVDLNEEMSRFKGCNYDCTTCKWGRYNDRWDMNFCYNPNECKDFGLYEKEENK